MPETQRNKLFRGAGNARDSKRARLRAIRLANNFRDPYISSLPNKSETVSQQRRRQQRGSGSSDGRHVYLDKHVMNCAGDQNGVKRR